MASPVSGLNVCIFLWLNATREGEVKRGRTALATWARRSEAKVVVVAPSPVGDKVLDGGRVSCDGHVASWPCLAGLNLACDWYVRAASDTYVNTRAIAERLSGFDHTVPWLFDLPVAVTAEHLSLLPCASRAWLRAHKTRGGEASWHHALPLGIPFHESILDWPSVTAHVRANHQASDVHWPGRRLRLNRCLLAVHPVEDPADLKWLHARLPHYRRHMLPALDKLYAEEGLDVGSLPRMLALGGADTCWLDPMEVFSTVRPSFHDALPGAEALRHEQVQVWLTSWWTRGSVWEPEQKCRWMFANLQCLSMYKVASSEVGYDGCIEICCKSLFCHTFAFHEQLGCWVKSFPDCYGPEDPAWRSGSLLERRPEIAVRDLMPPTWLGRTTEGDLRKVGTADVLGPLLADEGAAALKDGLVMKARAETGLFKVASQALSELLAASPEVLDDPGHPRRELLDGLAAAAAEHRVQAGEAGLAFMALEAPTSNGQLAEGIAVEHVGKDDIDDKRKLQALVERALNGASEEYSRRFFSGRLLHWLHLCRKQSLLQGTNGGHCFRTSYWLVMGLLKEFGRPAEQAEFLEHIQSVPLLNWALCWRSLAVTPRYAAEGDFGDSRESLTADGALYADQVRRLLRTLERRWEAFAAECAPYYQEMEAAPWPTLFTERDDWRLTVLYASGRGWDAELCERRFPRTCAALRRAFPLRRDREAETAKFAARHLESEEEVGFFALTPGSRVRPHNGGTNLRLNIHVGLAGVHGAELLLPGGLRRAWRLGRALIFNDGADHAVEHRGNATRLVLFVRMRHPEASLMELAGAKAKDYQLHQALLSMDWKL